MLVYLRTDADPRIGTGHLMRCLTLADALKSNGATCVFVCHSIPTQLSTLVNNRGHTVINLPANFNASGQHTVRHSSKANIEWLDDARKTINAIGNNTADWLIVDHYALDINWEKSLRSKCRRIMVIDDLADRPHDCDILLDQGLHDNIKDRYSNLVPDTCKLLLGPKNVLLHPNFEYDQNTARTGEVKNVLVYFGGNDLTNQTSNAIEALKTFPNLMVEVVLGINHPHKHAAYNAAIGHPNIKVLETISNMSASMARADLALGVCGIAAWERCAMGLPTIVCILAENQHDDTVALHRLGAVENLGEANHLNAKTWMNAIDCLLKDSSRIRTMSKSALSIIEGHRENFQLLLRELCLHE